MPYDEDDDPVVATYNVHIAPTPTSQKLYILQYPSHRPRSKPYDTLHGQKPDAFRIKPNAGVFELDVPLPHGNYNSTLGTDFGRAMNDSAQLHPTTGHGLSGGFAQTSTTKPNLNDVPDHASQPLQSQTLGGKISHSTERDPVYMLATLNPTTRQIQLRHLDGVVQMRPQLHHVDAIDEMKKRADVKKPEGPVKLETRAIEMKLKDKDDPKDRNLNANAKLLRDIQNDEWVRYGWNEGGVVKGDTSDVQLSAALDNDEWLNCMSSPGIELRTRLKGRDRERARRKRQERLRLKKPVDGGDISDSESSGDEADIGPNVVAPPSPEVRIKKEAEPVSVAVSTPAPAPEPEPAPKRRGRPPKNATAQP